MIDERTVQGIITDIQRFSVHDGQGIRTVIFLKGCPLRCLWCHNPETNRSCVEMAYYRDKCIGCGQCLRVCPSGAIAEEGAVDQIRCTQCGMCADACCTRARVRIGQQKTAGELFKPGATRQRVLSFHRRNDAERRRAHYATRICTGTSASGKGRRHPHSYRDLWLLPLGRSGANSECLRSIPV